ncbi:phosphotransferase [Zhihengliuella sp.]|uniref:phosphotransferase n=1 Tax=Zhihengliuella sp. TaxID=1954483 RepID=UPI002812756C|nr:phosphotransferase [Zhihengliuella sp.]
MRAPTPAEIQLAEGLLPGPAWHDGVVEEGGQFHLVLVADGEAVLRMARNAAAAAELPRRTALADALAPLLPYRVPRSLTPVWQAEDRHVADPGAAVSARPGASRPASTPPVPAAVVQEFVPGRAHEPHRGDPAALRDVVECLAGIDVEPLRPLLARPFAYRGPWTARKRAAAVAALPEAAAPSAEAVLARIEAFADVPGGLVHGDLAGHNMHWDGDRLLGILDWDLAADWDPALNAAYLGMWHGKELVPLIAADRDEARRAAVWDGAMALEAVYNASLRSDRPNWARLYRKTLPRIEAAALAAR